MPKLPDKLPTIDLNAPRLYSRILEAADAERQRRKLGISEAEARRERATKAWLLQVRKLDGETSETSPQS